MTRAPSRNGRARPASRAGRRAACLTTAAVAAAACVRIDTAPGGIASTRLAAAPPSIALGDSLRDSTGVAVRVRGVAYDANGAETPTAGFHYSYLPYTPDTTAGAVVDTALVVDSATGAVRATGKWVQSRGRVFAGLGSGGIQLADTIQIVPPPDSLVATAATDTLRFDCTDPRTTVVQRDTLTGFSNTVGPFTLAVRGDSAGTRMGVRRWLVRWSLDAVPAAVPTVPLPAGQTVPAIAIITNAADAVVRYDTTDGSGISNVRLRIRPAALGKSYSPDTLFTVRLRADVIRGAGRPLMGSPASDFVVVLSRRSVPPTGTTAVTCQR